MIFKFFPKFTFWIMLLFLMRSGSEMRNCPEFASLIAASGFIEHTKTVSWGKPAGKD